MIEDDLDPRKGRSTLRVEGPAVAVAEATAFNLARDDDTDDNRRGRGRPAVTTIIPLEQLKAESEQQTREEFESELNARFFRLPKFLSAPLAWLSLMLALTLATFFVLGQAGTTWTAISALPYWGRWPGLSVLVVLSGLTLYSALRLMLIYRRLTVNRQIPLRDLRRLEERSHLRSLALAHKAEGVVQLKAFLNSYPLESPDQLKKLEEAGMQRNELVALQAAKRKLLDTDRNPGTSGWLDDFVGEFQGVLDTAARRTIEYTARLVGAKTAASPYALLDFLIVLSANFQILSRLLVIYQLRMGSTSTCVTLAQIFFGSLLSSQLEDVQETVSDEISNSLGAGLVASLGSKFSTKVSKGILNYLLLARLSRLTVRMLQPVAVKR